MPVKQAIALKSYALLLAVTFLSPSIALSDEILFFDDFKDGTADNWELIDIGYFSVQDETLCLETLCEP